MTNQDLLDRVLGRDPGIRAGDADRERVADRLRTSHGEGRLDIAEFQQRLERCYEAKTLGELGELVGDLPRPHDQDEGRAAGWFQLSRGLIAAPLVPILIVAIVISAIAGHHVFWLWIPLLFLFWKMSWWHRRRWAAGPPRGPGEWI
jgi:hypothetical protein